MQLTFPFDFGFGKIFLSKFKYRDRATIVEHILDSLNGNPKGKTKTSIMRGANLNFDQVNRYLDFLVLCDLVKAMEPVTSQEQARYKLTERGLSFLRDFEAWHLVLESYRRGII